MQKLVLGWALLMDKMTEMASMMVEGYQGRKYVISLLELPCLVEHLARMPWMETTIKEQKINKIEPSNLIFCVI